MQKCVSHTLTHKGIGREEEAPNDQLTYIQFAADAAAKQLAKLISGCRFVWEPAR
jgi:hypothetical protein